MKLKTILIEIIILTLVSNFFYEGIYKVAHFGSYSLWLHHAPLLKPAAGILQYLLPSGEIAVALALVAPTYRGPVLNIIMISSLVFVLWIMSVYLFTHRIFWPYHALWNKPTWMQKMLISMAICWLGFTGIVLMDQLSNESHRRNKLLRKSSANAQ